LQVHNKSWISENKDSLGALWLKCLAFYSIDFGFKKALISIRQRKSLPKASVKMYTKKISIEDPFCLKQSLSRNLANLTSKYVINIVRKSCIYFSKNTQSLKSNTTLSKSSDYDQTDKHKLIDRLIEETGITEARKFSACNDSDDEDEVVDGDEEEDEEDDEESTVSSRGSVAGEDSDTEIDEESESGERDNAAETEHDLIEGAGVFVDYENQEIGQTSDLKVSNDASLKHEDQFDLNEKMSNVKLASSESSSVLTSLEHCEAELVEASIIQVAETAHIDYVKQCLDEILHSISSSFDIMPNVNLTVESFPLMSQPQKNMFIFTASAIGFSTVRKYYFI
jgi:hypothetical protein